MALSLMGDSYGLPDRDLSVTERLRLATFFLLVACVVAAAIILRVAPVPAVSLAVGDVSSRDILASRDITYVSEVLTERARAAAEAEIGTLYDAPDTSIARAQVSLARQVLDRIGSIRGDEQLSHEAKVQALSDLGEVTLGADVAELVLSFDENEWLQVEREIVRVLDQTMRMVIREVDLADTTRRIPTLLSFDLSEEQAQVVVNIVSGLVRPNTLANEERTAEARKRAREAVQPISQTFQSGQVVVRAGDRVTELQREALEQIGLTQPERDWEEDLAAFVSVLVLFALIYIYILMREPGIGRDWRRMGLVALECIAFAILARFMVEAHVLLPYVFPAAALPMLVTVLVSPGLALIVALLPAVFYLNLASGALLELAAYGTIGSLVGVLLLSRMRHLKAFVWAGIGVLVANAAMLALYRVPSGNYDTAGMVSLMAAAVVNAGLASSLTSVGYLLVSNFLGSITSLQLLELSRPTQPLLRELLLKAPGTYHHSIMVANMAEQAAERIGANALLARVGAYYHDIGKVERPYFFSENQTEGTNVHDRLDPGSSAQIIISHVAEGLTVARDARIPPAIMHFIAEHHGRSRQDYFYKQAMSRQNDEKLPEEDFRYPGPRPRTKETAIVMLADVCEATVRATRPESVEELSRLIERIVDDRILEGELDESPLTLHDIAAIKASFVNVLQGVFHPRVKYPDGSLVSSREETLASAKNAATSAAGEEQQAAEVIEAYAADSELLSLNPSLEGESETILQFQEDEEEEIIAAMNEDEEE